MGQLASASLAALFVPRRTSCLHRHGPQHCTCICPENNAPRPLPALPRPPCLLQLPISALLGGAILADRADLLGRTAIHVASATGKVDVVQGLLAAGCDVNKPLSMDYR